MGQHAEITLKRKWWEEYKGISNWFAEVLNGQQYLMGGKNNMINSCHSMKNMGTAKFLDRIKIEALLIG